MYDKVKKFLDIIRVIDEDNDYLFKEEYNELLRIRNNHAHAEKILKVYNQYAKEHIDKWKNNESDKIELIKIKIIKPVNYSSSGSCNYIDFVVCICEQAETPYLSRPSKRYERVRERTHTEKQFKSHFIRDYNQILQDAVEGSTFLEFNNSRYDDYYTYKFAPRNYIEDINARSKDINDLVNYYKDKVITIEQDERLVNELKDINDFFDNL